MSGPTTSITADQLLQLRDDRHRYELVMGELRMMSPAGGRHGRVAHNVGLLLGQHVRTADLGVVYAAETGFLLAHDPDTVRAPDVAYVSHERLQSVGDDRGFLPLAPDLVAEVISPHDTFTQVEEKAFCWLAAGTQLVLLIDPATKTVHAYRSADNIAVFREQESCDAADVVAGWTFAVADLFV